MTMQTEREAVGAAVDATIKREEPLRFEPEQRNMLLQHYAGLAMQSTVAKGHYLTADNADMCVNEANALVHALERFANLEAAKVQGNG